VMWTNGRCVHILERLDVVADERYLQKSRYQRALTDHNKTLAELNRELSTLRESHKIYKNQLRDLELNNDELENAERMVASSLDDMENRYNKAIERTAMLEEELLEKGRLEEENQRLKDALQGEC
jgi:translation initiation factor 2B subunit (eIF-2B alpha/beta/delta family)